MENNNKIVEFDKYCNKCIHHDKDEHEYPCNDCLSNPTNVNSIKPIYFKEKEDVDKKKENKNTEEENEG